MLDLKDVKTPELVKELFKRGFYISYLLPDNKKTSDTYIHDSAATWFPYGPHHSPHFLVTDVSMFSSFLSKAFKGYKEANIKLMKDLDKIEECLGKIPGIYILREDLQSLNNEIKKAVKYIKTQRNA